VVWDTRLAFSHVATIEIGSFGLQHAGATICTKRDTRLLIPADFGTQNLTLSSFLIRLPRRPQF